MNNLRDSKAEEKSWVVVPAAAEVGNPVVAQDTELVAAQDQAVGTQDQAVVAAQDQAVAGQAVAPAQDKAVSA